MAKTPFEEVKSRTNFLERIEMLIPGFRGYKLKELRREADKLLRNYIYRQLNLSERGLKEVYQKLVDNKFTDLWTDMDRLVTRFDTVAAQINRSSYGYSGFFDAVKINEKELDAMLDFDSKLVEKIRELDDKAKAFKSEVLNGRYENIRSHIREINSDLNMLTTLHNERKDVILGVI